MTTFGEIIESNVDEIIDVFVHKTRAYDLPPREASESELMDALHSYVRSVAASLPTAEPVHADAGAKAHGEQRWLAGYDLKSVILEYGILRASIFEVVERRGRPMTAAELDEVAGILYSGAAAAAVEFTVRSTARLNEALSAAEAAVRAHQEIVAIVSHDLKNPLHVIQGSVSLLDEELALPTLVRAPLLSGVGRIGRAAERMNRLITDLLELSKIKAGHVEITVGPEETRDLLDEVVEHLAPLAEQRSVRLVEDDRFSGSLSCDRDRLMQVFENVIGNAIKFSPEGSEIVVRAERVDGECVFSVRDQGPGIPAADIPMLFERFWTAQRTVTSAGTGLGLAIAKGVVEAHGGRIWVESEVGRGTVFYFSLSAEPR